MHFEQPNMSPDYHALMIIIQTPVKGHQEKLSDESICILPIKIMLLLF